jgi:hypothetical protein
MWPTPYLGGMQRLLRDVAVGGLQHGQSGRVRLETALPGSGSGGVADSVGGSSRASRADASTGSAGRPAM